jgi:hypothetical protein
VEELIRTVADAALMLDAMAGLDARDPLSLEAPGCPFADAAAPALPADRLHPRSGRRDTGRRVRSGKRAAGRWSDGAAGVEGGGVV